MNPQKDVLFLAEAICVAEQMKDNGSLFYCKVIQGETYKGDIVKILDQNQECIVEQKISSIQHSKFLDKVSKDDSEDEIVWFIFYHIYDFPIKDAMYIIKMNSDVNGGKFDPKRVEKMNIPPTDLRTQLLYSKRVECGSVGESDDSGALLSTTVTDTDQLLKKCSRRRWFFSLKS